MHQPTITITLPWPAKGLSPNARLHWRPKAILTKASRAAAKAKAETAIRGIETATSDALIPVSVTFLPPDRRHRDDDGMVSSLKSGRDGIADGLGVNDRRFRCSYTVGEPVTGGAVIVQIPVSALQGAMEAVGQATHAAPEWLSRS